jgi:glutamate--cysteine ligase
LIEQVPMYFVYRDGGYIDVAGQSFAAFMAGRVPALAGVTATLGDFADHVTTAFTDVRLKRFLEMRGADAGRPDMMLAQSALWVGLLYDPAALSAAEALLRGASWQDAITARAAVPRQGLAAPWRGGTLRDIVADVVAIATDGLRARGRINAAGEDEQAYLQPLQAVAAGAPTQAEHWLERYNRAWGGEAGRIFHEAAV